MCKTERYWQNWDVGQAARCIDKYWRNNEAGWYRILVRDIAVQLGKPRSVLEVGCGSGMAYGYMLERGIVTPDTYTGGDASQKMLAIARRHFPEARFIDLDIFDLPYPDRSQPNVICINVLQHLPHYRRGVCELLRVTNHKLYIVGWFATDTGDRLSFTKPLDELGGQRFYDNHYSLPKFLGFISDERGAFNTTVHHFEYQAYGANYSITLEFQR